MIKECKQCGAWACNFNCKSVITYLTNKNVSLSKEVEALKDTIRNLKFIKNPEVRMIEVNDSSLIDSFGYDVKKSNLYFKFGGGSEYVYQGVPVDIFTSMVNATSRGKFYNDYVKGRFDVIKINN